MYCHRGPQTVSSCTLGVRAVWCTLCGVKVLRVASTVVQAMCGAGYVESESTVAQAVRSASHVR
eukprot:8778485-Pyramimonas_sp.AAC.1